MQTSDKMDTFPEITFEDLDSVFQDSCLVLEDLPSLYDLDELFPDIDKALEKGEMTGDLEKIFPDEALEEGEITGDSTPTASDTPVVEAPVAEASPTVPDETPVRKQKIAFAPDRKQKITFAPDETPVQKQKITFTPVRKTLKRKITFTPEAPQKISVDEYLKRKEGRQQKIEPPRKKITLPTCATPERNVSFLPLTPQKHVNKERIVSDPRVKRRLCFTSPRENMKPSCIVTKHRHMFGVLAMRPDGYTLTNGRLSVSNSDLTSVSYDIFYMCLKTVYMVDWKTHKLWDKYATTWVENQVMDPLTHPTPCEFCQNHGCHRWMATVEGIHRLIPSKPTIVEHFPTKQRTIHPTSVTLCINTEGYTVSNGRLSMSYDGKDDENRHLLDTLNRSRVEDIFLVDDYTASVFQDKSFRTVKMAASSVGPCTYCKTPKCHRWKAVVGGISRNLKYPIDPIRH